MRERYEREIIAPSWLFFIRLTFRFSLYIYTLKSFHFTQMYSSFNNNLCSFKTIGVGGEMGEYERLKKEPLCGTSSVHRRNVYFFKRGLIIVLYASLLVCFPINHLPRPHIRGLFYITAFFYFLKWSEADAILLTRHTVLHWAWYSLRVVHSCRFISCT